MKIKDWKEVIEDACDIKGRWAQKTFLTFCRLRIENGDPNYLPEGREIMSAMGRNNIKGMNSVFGILVESGLLPKYYSHCGRADKLFDEHGVEINQGDKGIYLIKCDHGCYIGLSVNLHHRLRTHLKQISKGEHPYILRNSNPKIYILERIEDKSLLLEREKFHALKAMECGLNVLNEDNFLDKEEK